MPLLMDEKADRGLGTSILTTNFTGNNNVNNITCKFISAKRPLITKLCVGCLGFILFKKFYTIQFIKSPLAI